jgi:hypothetical protein
MIEVEKLYNVHYRYNGSDECIVTDNVNECITKVIEGMGEKVTRSVDVCPIKCTKIILYNN